jgi:hypothetical protein
MNLHGSITEFQNTVVRLYLKLEHRFKENGLIRELWSAMAHDVSQQINSLKALPPSFWNQLKKHRNGAFEAVIQGARQQVTVETEDLSLKGCFELALGLEEPTILKIYVPIIRYLRDNWTNPALDFYIMVKAHLARILRMTESFSGDPVVVQRSNLLLQSFEKEVQEPQAALRYAGKNSRASRPAEQKRQVRKLKEASRHARPLARRAEMRHSRTKPLVKKVDLQRRRAHR